MRILLTGSSGWLGQALAKLLRQCGHEIVGLDPRPSPQTTIVGSIADRGTVRAAIRDFAVDAVVHAGALHKPDIDARERADFIAVNVQGTLNLLEEAVAPGSRVDRFVFTSTTSLMISRAIRDGLSGGARAAAWLTEETVPLMPRNIYGVTKLSAEHLCRLFHELYGLPVVILRTARFFPEADDMAHAIVQSDANTKTNEFLFRRLTVEDAAERASAGARLRHLHHLGKDALLPRRLHGAPDRCACRRRALLPGLPSALRTARLDDVPVDRSHLRCGQGVKPPRLPVPHRLRGEARRARGAPRRRWRRRSNPLGIRAGRAAAAAVALKRSAR